jgi:opacity protein-like surface antigen
MQNLKKSFLSLAVLACATCAANGAWAQTTKPANFIGPAVGVAISAQRYTLDRDPAWTSNMTGTGTGVDLVGSWGLALSPQWVATIGATLGLKNSDIYTETNAGVTFTATSKQRFSLSVAPGYRLGAGGLLYGKAGYHSMVVGYDAIGFSSTTKTHQGFGLGFGYAHALTANLELRGEFESVAYSGENTTATVKLTPKQTNVNLGLLYKF